MYELKKIGKVFTSKFVGTWYSSYQKRIYRTAVSQRLRNTALDDLVLDLYLRGPEDDLTRVETYNPRCNVEVGHFRQNSSAISRPHSSTFGY